MSIIIKAKTSYPNNDYSQKELGHYLSSIYPERAPVIDKIFTNALVEKRSLALPLESYRDLSGLELRNHHWIETAINLQTKNLDYFFEDLKFPIEDISLILSTTITGLSIPSLEAKLMNRFSFSKKTKRVPIFGLGCLGGVSLIARAHDYLKAYPKEAVLILATELCSLTFQINDFNMSNLIGTSLFADGAGAVLMVGDEHPWNSRGAYRVCSSESMFFPKTERIMGWDIVDQGFKLVLSGDVPTIVKENFIPPIQEVLKNHQLDLKDIKFYISHPGGPKVLTAMEESLGLENNELQFSYQSLKEHGNMSSVSVLNVLEKTINTFSNQKSTNQNGLMLAMGPAFCGEAILVKEM
jgi:alkylresorcinol/alkylpyrone synthase